MQLAHIEFDMLSISPTNMRHGKRMPDIADILPSIRARGVLVPLLVRPGNEPDHFEIVAGRRRYFSAKTVKEEQGDIDPLPCAIMEPGDDAAALEASLLENIARFDPDSMQQYETFVQLVRNGRGIGEIAATFGLTERQVKQRLALGNLLPKIRDAYRAQEIDEETIQYLTLATKSQQKDWLAFFSDERRLYMPLRAELKRWLFGGRSISTTVALFPLDGYPGEIVTDLFGEDGYFADADLFWQHQNAAVAAKKQAYLDAGWKIAEVMEQAAPFHSWEYEKTPKKRGGRVVIAVSDRGEVTCHEGYLSRKEATRQRAGKAEGTDAALVKPQRPEVSGPLQAYIDLHRHAAVRNVLADHCAVALRLLLAHLIAGSSPWQRRFEPPISHHEGTTASLAASVSHTAFQVRRTGIAELLGEPAESESILRRHGDHDETVAAFRQLLELADSDVMQIAALVMAEALQPGTPVIDVLGVHFEVDMAAVWQADDAFFELVRDREVVNAMMTDVAGPATAAMYVSETSKRQKEIIRDYMTGSNGRPQVDSWLPRWMTFPAAHYTERGGLKAVEYQNRLTEMASQLSAESATTDPANA